LLFQLLYLLPLLRLLYSFFSSLISFAKSATNSTYLHSENEAKNLAEFINKNYGVSSLVIKADVGKEDEVFVDEIFTIQPVLGINLWACLLQRKGPTRLVL